MTDSDDVELAVCPWCLCEHCICNSANTEKEHADDPHGH